MNQSENLRSSYFAANEEFAEDEQKELENYPPIKDYPTGQNLVDWNERDEEAAPKIKELAAELKSLPGRPIFVSKTILYRRLKIANLMSSPELDFITNYSYEETP